MSSGNISGFIPQTLILIGFPGLEEYYIWFAVLLTAVYLVILLGNAILLLVTTTVRSLHQPMYLLISQQAVNDLVLSSCILPKTLAILWSNAGEIHLSACLLQLFLLSALGAFRSSILTVMAFDRYVAVCNPLRYSSILTHSLLAKIAFACLFRVCVMSAPMPLLILRLPFCKMNITHSCCENMPVANLACVDITVNSIYALVVSLLIAPLDLSFIAWSYFLILRVVLNRSQKKERIKFFSTCTCHICAMAVAYVPTLFSIILRRLQHDIPLSIQVIVANTYLVFPPLINPIIYGGTLKTVQQEVKQILQKINVRLFFNRK